MQKGDPLSFCPHPGRPVDKLYSGSSASLERGIDVRHRDTNVMYPSAAASEIFPDRRIRRRGFQELDQRPAAFHRRYPRAVRICDLDLRHPEHIAEKWDNRRERFHGDPDVGNAR